MTLVGDAPMAAGSGACRRAGYTLITPMPTATEPVAIRAERAEGTLYVTWADGHESEYSLEYLRWRCACAPCRGEMGRPGLLDTLERLRPEQYQLRDIRPVGRYAIQPVWADGHDTGIYAFDYLRFICPCPHCSALREQSTSPKQDSQDAR